ncbi:MAG: amidohydrolase family protein [Pseudomonadota bacterium]
MAWVAGEALGLFGADRCLYGSNFPIEKLWTDYRSLFGAVTDALGDRSEVERAAVLGGTAARVYGLTPP